MEEIITSKEQAQSVEAVQPQETTASGITTASGVTAPSAVNTKPERRISYTLRLPIVGGFDVVESANGWWMDSRKVSRLFDAYKNMATDEIACGEADISLWQLRMFRELHPNFPQVKEALKKMRITGFLNTLNSKGQEDLPTVRWYLSKFHEDFKEKEKVETPPVMQQQQVIINQNVDTAKIEEAIERAADAILSQRGAESPDTELNRQDMEEEG